MADDLFEAAQMVEQGYPDDISSWPEPIRLCAYAARDRLLKREPGLSVVAERSYCIGRDDPRFPDDVPLKWTHSLVYEVKLSPGPGAAG
jgi:hypothetical protein